MKINKFYLILFAPIFAFSFNVGDRVWNDINQNWEQDIGEKGFANVRVELYNATGVKLQTTQTNAHGKYNFANVLEGEYVVKIIVPIGVNIVTSNNRELWVERNRIDIDFGLYLGKKFSVGNKVWNDINKDWDQDANEKGIANVIVELYDDTGIKLQSTQTDADGQYAFSNVSEGEHLIKIIPPLGVEMVTLNNTEFWVDANRVDIDFGVYIKKPDNNTPTVVINEILAGNANTNLDPDYKQFSDWIELRNTKNHLVDIGGFYLSDDEEEVEKWYIPVGTTIEANGYLVIWADGEDDKFNALHTNFKLSQKGETVLLSNDDGILVDSITFPKQEADISCKKEADKIVYMNPTPGRKNSLTNVKLKKSKKPKFSLESGFYNATQNIVLTQKNVADIYYTIDGSIPTTLSTKYTQPIRVAKTTVIRARSLENGKFLSSSENRTYLINENISLPVVSIGMNDAYLNDDEIGIYKNFTEKWMRAASIEYIKDGKSKFNENVGIRIFGGHTREFAQKSLAIFAKNKYGSKSIKYPLFPEKQNIKKIKSFVLRNSGNDWGYTMMKDGLIQTIVKDTMDIDYQSYHPSIVFINGKYWGIHNIREKINEDYIEANHGVDSKKLDLLEAQDEIQAGSRTEYDSLINYIETHSLKVNSNYNHIKSKMDIDEYINYMIVETYVGNVDWPYTNIKYWREQTPTGKWRWILYDTDVSFYNHIDTDPFQHILTPVATRESNPAWSTFLFRSLMENKLFRNQFISTFLSHLDTTFKPSRMARVITTLKNEIKPEIQRHFDKWGRRSPKDWETGNGDSIRELYEFSEVRAKRIRFLIKKNFNVE